MKEIRFFVSCHKNFPVPKDPLLVPVQEGTALAGERYPGFFHDFANKKGILSGPIFRTRGSRPMHRTYMSAVIRNLCEEARVPSEKGNPKSLRKQYLATRAGVESNISLLVDQIMERMIEQEQFSVGWEEA